MNDDGVIGGWGKGMGEVKNAFERVLIKIKENI